MEEIIDKYLNEIVSTELNSLPMEIEPEMADPNQDKSEEWRTWFPVKSTVSDDEIKAFESQLKYSLPEAYKSFLKYKYFYDLSIHECRFCDHPIRNWKETLLGMMTDDYPSEFLIEKGRIPFADWSDWGLLCFDTTAECKDFDYPIVLWDHEVYDQYQLMYDSFEAMLIQLDQEEMEAREE